MASCRSERLRRRLASREEMTAAAPMVTHHSSASHDLRKLQRPGLRGRFIAPGSLTRQLVRLVTPAASLPPRRDCGESSARGRFTAVADAPLGLDAAVDADDDAERFGAVPPAEVRASDDPGVLVPPVTLVGGRRAASRRQPGVEAPG